MTNLQCLECGKEVTNPHSLTQHAFLAHKIRAKEYYDKYIKKPGEGVCLNCGSFTKYNWFSFGYSKCCSSYCRCLLNADKLRGQLDFKKIMSLRVKKMYRDGYSSPILGAIPWNKGKTKETNDTLREISKRMIHWSGKVQENILNLYGPEYSVDFRISVKKRDGYKCQLCGSTHHVQCHHIDYNKRNSSLDNPVTLCSGCHNKTHYNREFWFNKLSKKQEALK